MLELYPYQREGVTFLSEKRVALLADQPGLGKTPQAIIAAKKVVTKTLSKPPRICIVTTKASVVNWRREFARWWPQLATGAVHIFHYDLLSLDGPGLEAFQAQEWDIIVADEAHKLKTPQAKRSQNFYDVAVKRANRGARVWLLTGTPAKNHPGELYLHLYSLRPDLIMNRGGSPMGLEEFEGRYCIIKQTQFGRSVDGARRDRIPALRKKLKGFMLRRLKKVVQKDLPELLFDVFPMNVTLRATEDVPEFPGLRSDMSHDEVVAAMKDNPCSTERRMLGALKAPFVADYVHEELDAPGKIIVFAHHRDTLDILERRLGAFKPARIDGRTADAQEQVDMFQEDPRCRVMLGQISACGEALTMTAATQVVFAEAAWSPSDNYQAACRAHRIGLSHGLVVRFLCIPQTLDDLIQRTLARKAQDLAELFD